MMTADFLAGVRCARRDVAETLRQLDKHIEAGTPLVVGDVAEIIDRVLEKYEALAEKQPN